MKMVRYLLPLMLCPFIAAQQPASFEELKKSFEKNFEALQQSLELLLAEPSMPTRAAPDQKATKPKEKLEKEHIALLSQMENLKRDYLNLKDSYASLQNMVTQQNNSAEILKENFRNTLTNLKSLQSNYFEKAGETQKAADDKKELFKNQLTAETMKICSEV